MATRKNISKSLRFEIFKRDSFTCQYCGEKAPDILLEVDHIEPVAKGGTNDLLNLITSCKNCNSGKSDKRLSDNTVIDKQRDQLQALQKRKEQIEMMFQWQSELLNLENDIDVRLCAYWTKLNPDFSLNENGLKNLRKLKKRFDVDEIMAAMKASAEHYVEYDEFDDGKATTKSVENAWKRIAGICIIKRQEIEKPYIQKLQYIRGILRNRFGLSFKDQALALELLEDALSANADIDSLENHAKTAANWMLWTGEIEYYVLTSSKADSID